MKQANHRSTLRGILTLGWPMFVSQLAVMAHGIIDTAIEHCPLGRLQE